MLNKVKSLTFEEALKELEIIVRKLEEEKLPLEEAIRCYEEGIVLKKHCEDKLTQARLKLEQVGASSPQLSDHIKEIASV